MVVLDSAVRGDTTALQRALEMGGNVNAKTREGATALIYPASTGNGDAVRLLLKAGAELNAVNVQGASALRAAADSGHAEVLRLLIDAGANVDEGSHNTALMFAAETGRVDIVDILLQKHFYVQQSEEIFQSFVRYSGLERVSTT